MFGYPLHRWLIVSCAASLAFSAPIPQEGPAPLYRITIERSIQAVSYRPNGSTNVDFKGTALAFESKGRANVATQRGVVRIEARFEKLPPASSFGPEFLTYVLWAISPEGRPRNMGEVVLKNQKGQLKATTSLQTFGMMLTAEPYFAVSVPSDVVVMENVVREDTLGATTPIDAKIELLQRGDYAKAGLQPVTVNPKVPLDLYQARNAVQVAKSAGAERYSADSLVKATRALQNAEGYQSRQKGDQRKLVVMTAREAVQAAEDARVIATRRAAEELAAAEKADAAAREAAAKAAAEREAQQKREAEQAAALAKAQAEREAQQKREAELTAALAKEQAQRAKAEAERQAQQKREADMAAALAQAARARAELEGERAKQEADRERREREAAQAAKLKAETEQRELRARLLAQFNAILETRDTTRGLVVNMGDVLFDTGKFDLRPPAREALARLSGIVLSHPGLKLEIEGHTDSVGSDEFNQELSERRAASVRQYLLAQKLPAEILSAKGFGKTMPVATNDTAQGRQQNRRVEIVVSGEVIGVDINATAQHP